MTGEAEPGKRSFKTPLSASMVWILRRVFWNTECGDGDEEEEEEEKEEEEDWVRGRYVI